jgi:hypothetical protein
MTTKTKGVGALQWFPAWARRAVAKSVAGLVLGLVTAVVLVWLSQRAFPGLQDYGEDLGLRVGVYLDRVAGSASGMPLRKGEGDVFSYVFLDVDPEIGVRSGAEQSARSAAQEVCDAYAEALRTGRTAPAPAGAVPTLNCSSARPLNRYLLAALVAALRERGARMIVLDVVLAEEEGVVDDAENAALRNTLLSGSSAGASVPLIIVAPYEMAGLQGDAASDGPVTLALPSLIAGDAARGIHTAAALPAPGQPVRRYPKCLRQSGADQSYVPSLPFLAAHLLRAGGQQNDACAPETEEPRPHEPGRQNAPRIVYTFPSMQAHQDDLLAPSRAAWAPYREIYNRCLAAHFWDGTESHCAQAQTYQDKVVVIGTSNPLRRDRHFTPLGDMAGAELVVNAVRSFVAYPDYRDKTFSETLGKKSIIVLWCGLVWLGYFLFRCWCFRAEEPKPLSMARVASRAAVLCFAFVVALLAVIAIALYGSFRRFGPAPSLDVLIPVLAIAVDEYVEQVSKVVHRVESWVESLLGVSSGHG